RGVAAATGLGQVATGGVAAGAAAARRRGARLRGGGVAAAAAGGLAVENAGEGLLEAVRTGDGELVALVLLHRGGDGLRLTRLDGVLLVQELEGERLVALVAGRDVHAALGAVLLGGD